MKLNMKKLKQLTHYGIVCAVMSLCAAGLPSCSDDYDDTDIRKEIQDVKDRVAKLEEWQKTVNSDITSIKGLVEALQQKNFITDVTPVTEGGEEVGYTITFQTGESITIKNGVNGKTPIIGVAKEGDTYYWTIKTGDADAVFMTDAEGNKMPVTGPKGENGADAVAPQVRINTESNEWELSTDGGETWNSTGVKATGANGEDGEKGDKGDKGDRGDAIFAEDGIDTESDPYNVIFTLADGTTLTVPKALPLSVGFDSYETVIVAQNSSEMKIILPATLQETDYVALAAEVKSVSGTGMGIYTKAASPWLITITEPTFTDGKYNDNAKVKIGATGIADGEKAILKVTLITDNGQEVSASRPFIFYNGTVVNPAAAGGMEAALNGLDPAEVKDLNIIGTLSTDDFNYIKENLKGSLERVNFSNADVTEIPDKVFYDFWELNEVILPENLEKIGYQAFVNCPIVSVTIPNSVTEIENEAFRAYNTKYAKLESVVIGSGMTEIPRECFYGQENLKSVSLPQGITKIGQSAFQKCYSLTAIELPDALKEIASQAFMYCGFTQIAIPDNVTIIGEKAFYSCSNLTDVTLSKSLKTLGGSVFDECGVIATIDLPETIETFGLNAFTWGKATTIICRAKKVPNPKLDINSPMWDNHFKSVTDKDAVVVKVPAESVKQYQTKWKKYFNNIVAIE